MKIISNYHKIPLLHYWQLPEKWQKVAKSEFDWDKNLEEESQMFIYKGNLYHMDNFPFYGKHSMFGSLPDPFIGWDSYENDSFFSGIVIRYVKDEYGYVEDNEGNYLLNVGWFYG